MFAQLQINDPLPDGTERWRSATPGDFGTTPDGKVLIGGARDKWRCGFNSLDEVASDFTLPESGVRIRIDGDTAGSRYMSVVRDSFAEPGTESVIRGLRDFSFPVRMGMGLSLNQRVHGEMFVVEAVAVDDSGNVIEEPGRKTFSDPVAVSSASVTSNVLLITTTVDHGLKMDDLVVIAGNGDTRINTVAKVSTVPDPRNFQVALTNANTTFAISGARVYKIEPAGSAASAFGLLIDGTTTSNAYCWSKSEGSSCSLGAYQSLGTTWSDPISLVAQNWCVSRVARFTTELTGTADLLRYISYPSDSSSGPAAMIKRTQNIPEMDRRYVLRFRVLTLPNAMPPIEILTATKSGTSIATVVTAQPHGLQTGAYVRIFGANDVTNWGPVTTETPITVTAPDTFTVAWGTAITGVTYGGAVKPVFSGMSTGIANQVPRGLACHGGRLWLGLSSSWTPSVGETVRLLGYRTNSGSLNLDGQYRVAAFNPVVVGSFQTTNGSPVVNCPDTSKLSPGMSVSGTGISGLAIASIVPNTSITLTGNATATGTTWLTLTGLVLEPLSRPAEPDGMIGSLAPVQGGGALVRESDFAIHFARVLDYTRTPVEVTGGTTTGDQGGSVPVAVSNTVTTNTPEGTPLSPTTHNLTSAATTNATLVKSTSGMVYNIALTNYGAAPAFFKLYNKSTAPTPGTDIPDMVLEVPAGKCVIFPFERFGYRCGSGIGYAITGAQAVNDTTAIAAAQVRVAMSFV